MVQGQFTGYGGGFNSPVITPGVQDLQFSTAYWVVPIPLPFGETVIQATDREISLLKARMNDAYAVTTQNMGTLIYTNNTGNSLFPDSFYNAFDNGTNVATYGGINRTAPGNTSFQGNVLTATSFSQGTGNVSTVGFGRASMSNTIIKVTDAAGGESPSYVVLNPSDFATLNTDFIGTEQTFLRPGQLETMGTHVRSSFPNLQVAGVPIFADHFCPKGTAYWVNSKYTSMYMSEDAAFEFSGFYSLVPLGQIGQQGVMICGYDVISAKPVSGAVMTGIGAGAF